MAWSLAGVPLGLVALVMGLSALSRGLAGGDTRRLAALLALLAGRPWQGVLLGAAITALIHSSSAFTITLVALADAGVISVRRAVPLVMGANIGTTLTSQLLAATMTGARLTEVGWVLAASGAVVWSRRLRRGGSGGGWGEALAGAGLVLLALEVLGRALAPLGDTPWFAAAMEHLARNPWSGLWAGFVLTSILMSSTATIAILQRLAADGLIGLSAALPVLFGDNVGTTTDTLLASAATGRAGRAVAVAHLLFNLAGTLIFMPLVPLFSGVLALLDADPARQIAHAHTIFNAVSTAFFLPFQGTLAALALRLAGARGQDFGEDA